MTTPKPHEFVLFRLGRWQHHKNRPDFSQPPLVVALPWRGEDNNPSQAIATFRQAAMQTNTVWQEIISELIWTTRDRQGCSAYLLFSGLNRKRIFRVHHKVLTGQGSVMGGRPDYAAEKASLVLLLSEAILAYLLEIEKEIAASEEELSD